MIQLSEINIRVPIWSHVIEFLFALLWKTWLENVPQIEYVYVSKTQSICWLCLFLKQDHIVVVAFPLLHFFFLL